jgi:hypothetical protein
MVAAGTGYTIIYLCGTPPFKMWLHIGILDGILPKRSTSGPTDAIFIGHDEE